MNLLDRMPNSHQAAQLNRRQKNRALAQKSQHFLAIFHVVLINTDIGAAHRNGSCQMTTLIRNARYIAAWSSEVDDTLILNRSGFAGG